MRQDWSVYRWANQLTKLLDVVRADDRYPVRVAEVAIEYSRQVFPDNPIELVKGADLPGFEGGLFPAPKGKGRGWAILYNNSVQSTGRVNFTLGHELGHYLAHRTKFPQGIQCDPKALMSWNSEYAKVESEANAFAAGLLMPLHDFRQQIAADVQPSLDDIGCCASRYDVSLLAATLRWLEYTNRRAVLVVSRDGFVKWARSSEAALQTGAFLSTRNVSPVPVPASSLAATADALFGKNQSIDCDATVWFGEPAREQVLLSDRFDFTISLIHLNNRSGVRDFGESPAEHDTFDQFLPRERGLFGEI